MLLALDVSVADFLGDFEDGVIDASLRVVGGHGVRRIGYMITEG